MAVVYKNGNQYNINAAYFNGKSLSKIVLNGKVFSLKKAICYYGFFRTLDDSVADLEDKGNYFTEEVIKAGTSAELSGSPAGNITVVGQEGDENYYLYAFYAFPTSAGTIRQVEDPAFPGSPNNTWAHKSMVIDGIDYTVWYYNDNNVIDDAHPSFTYVFVE